MRVAVLTLNPGVDRVVYLSAPTVLGSLNRAGRVVMSQGSKGANVAAMLHVLGAGVDHISFTGGVFGGIAEAKLGEYGVISKTVPTGSGVRMNTKIIDSEGVCTEFNERGGPVSPGECDELLALLEGGYDIIVLTGSIPLGVDTDIYRRITEKHRDSARIVVDCDGEVMRCALRARPSLIKPNRRELAGILGVGEDQLADDPAVFSAARCVHHKYGCDVICTLDADGSVYVGEAGEYRVGAAHVPLRGFSGAGDTYLAAFIMKYYVLGEDILSSLTYASRAAGAKVALEGSTLPRPEQIEECVFPHGGRRSDI